MSFVYFVHSPAANLVKIGRSKHPERRLAELLQLSPVPLHIIGKCSGRSGIESYLQGYFRDIHSHGEWFFALPLLLSAMRSEDPLRALLSINASVRRHG